jgi:hypothetical protein
MVQELPLLALAELQLVAVSGFTPEQVKSGLAPSQMPSPVSLAKVNQLFVEPQNHSIWPVSELVLHTQPRGVPVTASRVMHCSHSVVHARPS